MNTITPKSQPVPDRPPAQAFFGRGKLLLTAEYFVLDGAQALALPVKWGQRLEIDPADETDDPPALHWHSLDDDFAPWLSARFDLKTLDIRDHHGRDATFLHNVLRQARALNPAFLQTDQPVRARTILEFPAAWGLGSSATLIYTIAKWADVSPFALAAATQGGSGYDIACAGADHPLLYRRVGGKPDVQTAAFDPPFRNHLYFIPLGRKQDTRRGIAHYKDINPPKNETITRLDSLTQAILKAETLEDFEHRIEEHERLIAGTLNLDRAQDTDFPGYWGQIKSLGAWGGDFVLATSDRDRDTTLAYFNERGYRTILGYDELIAGAS